MFKYIKYKKVQTQYTILEFSSGNEDTTVNHFDVEVVSIEGDETNIDILISNQDALIECEEIALDEFNVLVENTSQLLRINDVVSNEVLKKYTPQQEIEILKMPKDDERVGEYNEYMKTCGQTGISLREELGAIQTLTEAHNNAIAQCDNDCKEYIYAYWSQESQSNVALGLYEQSVSELCKEEVSLVLADNVIHVENIQNMSTVENVEHYMSMLVRVAITGGRPVVTFGIKVKPSRVDSQFLDDQKTRRVGLNDSDPTSHNSVPALRDRVTVVERLLSIRDEPSS